MPNFDLIENGDGTFTLSLYGPGDTVPYATMIASPRDTVYNLFYNVMEPGNQPGGIAGTQSDIIRTASPV